MSDYKVCDNGVIREATAEEITQIQKDGKDWTDNQPTEKLNTIKDGVWMAKPPFVRNSPALFAVPEYETFDIDYPWQFNVAEELYLKDEKKSEK